MAQGLQLTIVLFLVFCTSPSLQYRSCGGGDFEIFQGRCYYFNRYSTQRFDDANNICKGKNALFVSVHSEEEDQYISNVMKNHANRFWIGMKKTSTSESPLEKNYKWVDGSTKDFKKWNGGEPNNGGGNEHCVEQYANGGAWNDIACYTYLKFVCTKEYVEGWVDSGNYQYYVSFMPEEIESTWYEARDWCMQNGGDLASVLSADEATKITGWASENDFSGDLWIGLNKLADKRTDWGWSDGSTFSNTWHNWASTYPRDGKYGDLCGYQTSTDTSGKWKNGHCDATKGFICKRVKTDNPTPKTTPPTTVVQGYCPAGYTGVGNKCFKVVFPGQKAEGALAFEEALVKCSQEPGIRPTLASIESELDQAFVDSQLQRFTWGVYIGLKRQTYGQDWLWVDSSPFEYEHWGPNQPDRSDEHCVEVWVSIGTLGMWNNIRCSDKRGYVCQTYKDGNNVIHTSPSPTGSFSCPEGFIQYWYGCYKYQETAYSYDQALSTCKSLDSRATLVGIHARAENAAIQTMTITKDTDLWIGFRDRNNSDVGEYKWEDGWNVLFTEWAGGQPHKEAGGGCVKMSPDGKWRDDVCAKQMPSICKISSIPPYTTPATLPGRCPSSDSWFEYGEHCYYISDRSDTWQGAKEDCQSKAFLSSLASIHSHAENQMIYDKIMQKSPYNKNVWIGLYRSQSDRTMMRWTDGGALQYENWAPGEPNNGVNKIQDCVEMWNDIWATQWNDHSCTDHERFVCKAPKVPHISIPTRSPHCSDGWKYRSGQCYLFQPDNWVPFDIAQRKCMEFGANLTSVHDIFENAYIEEEIKLSSNQPSQQPRYWIGMKADTTDGDDDGDNMVGAWQDGTEVDYAHWEQDEPSFTKETKCVSADVTKGRWKADKCETHLGFACMRCSNYTNDGQTTKDGQSTKDGQTTTAGQGTKGPTDGGTGGPGSASGGMSGGAVAGAVIGSILGAILIAFLVVIVLMKMGVIEDRLTSMGRPTMPYETHTNDNEKTV